MNTMDEGRTRSTGWTTGTEERPPQNLGGSVLTFDLDEEIAQLHREESWRRDDQNAKTLVKDGDVRIMLIALKAGARLPEHHLPARIAIQTLAGQLHVVMSDQTTTLKAGSLVTLEGGLVHAVEAIEESAFLLTIAWRGVEPHPLERGTGGLAGEATNAQRND